MFALVVARNKEAAQQLSDRRFRQGIDEDEAPGTLEIRKSRGAAELFEILLGDGASAFHKGRDDLAPFLVVEANNGDFENGRVQRKTAFDLDRRDVFAPGDDHVVDTAGDEQIAI